VIVNAVGEEITLTVTKPKKGHKVAAVAETSGDDAPAVDAISEDTPPV
jgi:hypothetical protein